MMLNVRDGVRLDVAVERTASTMFGYSLSGRVDSPTVGFVTLVVHDEAVAGSIWTPDATYELSYLGGGVHALRDVTTAPPVKCAGALPANLSAKEATPPSGAELDNEVPEVDILVVWTPAREEQLGGGASSMRHLIDLSIAYTNDALERSGANLRLNLVGAERVTYVEDQERGQGSYAALNALRDGEVDNALSLRDDLGADLVSLAMIGTGRAEINGPFSVSYGTPYVFSHEIGHNLGLLHDRVETNYGSFNFGYVPPRSLIAPVAGADRYSHKVGGVLNSMQPR